MTQETHQQTWNRAAQAEYDMQANALTAAHNEVEASWAQIQNARLTGNYDAEQHAMARHGEASARVAMLEADVNGRVDPSSQPQQQRQYTANEIINGMPNPSVQERQWLMQHPELVTTQEGQLRLQAAWYESQQKGMERNSNRYFDFFDDRFGFSRPQQSNGGIDPRIVGDPAMRARYAAPAQPYVPERPKVNLTPREAAKIAGVSEEVWHANNKRLQELKKEGYYNDR
jgi:hypothetical protein